MTHALDPAAAAGRMPTTSTADLAETLPGIVWEADGTDYRMTYVSPRAWDLLGLDADEWTTVPGFWESHLHPDDRERTIATVESALPSLSAISCAYRFRGGDGEYRHIRDVIQVIEHPDGHRHLVGFMLDVTGEAAAEAERRLLATAVEQALESVVITDEDLRIIYVNPAFERVSGYRRDQAVGHDVHLLDAGPAVPGGDPWRAVRAGKAWAGDLTSRRRDGTTYTEEASITPVVDAHGRVLHRVAVKRDVTVERADREHRDRLAAILESAADAGYATDLDAVYLAWNDAATRLYGWTRDEVIGLAAYDLVDASEHGSIREWVRRVANGETIGPLDTTHRGRDGRLLTLSVTASPVRDAAGSVTGVATIARDVSGERRLAAERAALEMQLLQAQKLEAIGRLAGGIAHDFNNMLTAITGYASLVAASLEGPLLEDQQQVLHAAARAAELTGRLLAFSRPTMLDPRPVDVDAVLREAFGMVRRMVPERIGFELTTGAGCHVLADPVEVEQLLLNLVVNAVDAIEGVGRIWVRTRVDRDSGGTSGRTLVLTVTDDGAGMDETTQSRIFEPFFTTKKLAAGTGLGLATVHAIVHRAGGSIDVRSAPGSGTAFEIALPAVDAAPVAEAAAEAPVVGGTERLLVIDDSVDVGGLTARILRDAGYDVVVASSPLEVLRDGVMGFDAIVSDVIMPGLSGPDLIARLHADLPVVFISGYLGSHDAQDLNGDRRRAFIPKPFSARSLLRSLRAVLDAPAT